MIWEVCEVKATAFYSVYDQQHSTVCGALDGKKCFPLDKELSVICSFLPNPVIQRSCHIFIDFSIWQRPIKFPTPLLYISSMRLMFWWGCKWNLRAVIFLLTMSLCHLYLQYAVMLHKVLYMSSLDGNKLAFRERQRDWTFILWLLRSEHAQFDGGIFHLFPSLRESW